MKKSRIRPVNPKRKRRLHRRNFGPHADKIREMRCAICGMPGPSDPAHTVGRKMGGCGGSAKDLVPLCRNCHRLLDTNPDFRARFLPGLKKLAEELWTGSRPPT